MNKNRSGTDSICFFFFFGSVQLLSVTSRPAFEVFSFFLAQGFF